NFFVPEAGIKTSEGTVSVSEFSNKLAEQVKLLAENPKAGPFVLGAIQNPNTSDRIKSIENLDGNVLLRSTSIENPMFSTARTSSPIIMGIKSTDNAIYNKELFGPVALIITTKDTDESIALAKELAEQYGAISCGAYTIDPAMKEKITDEMTSVFAPVSFNLDGAVYLNQHAAFSDFHVTGGNPAGNASFVNPEYIIRRFTWVGIRE
ncbi:MAG: aldehyde dehydrogenase family protein, partial [Cyclobacteriaceae bacterium]|nr:aldehyde dehydrogenase family protein [Cyclobacteriaceae bacterium]